MIKFTWKAIYSSTQLMDICSELTVFVSWGFCYIKSWGEKDGMDVGVKDRGVVSPRIVLVSMYILTFCLTVYFWRLQVCDTSFYKMLFDQIFEQLHVHVYTSWTCNILMNFKYTSTHARDSSEIILTCIWLHIKTCTFPHQVTSVSFKCFSAYYYNLNTNVPTYLVPTYKMALPSTS